MRFLELLFENPYNTLLLYRSFNKKMSKSENNRPIVMEPIPSEECCTYCLLKTFDAINTTDLVDCNKRIKTIPEIPTCGDLSKSVVRSAIRKGLVNGELNIHWIKVTFKNPDVESYGQPSDGNVYLEYIVDCRKNNGSYSLTLDSSLLDIPTPVDEEFKPMYPRHAQRINNIMAFLYRCWRDTDSDFNGFFRF